MTNSDRIGIRPSLTGSTWNQCIRQVLVVRIIRRRLGEPEARDDPDCVDNQRRRGRRVCQSRGAAHSLNMLLEHWPEQESPSTHWQRFRPFSHRQFAAKLSPVPRR